MNRKFLLKEGDYKSIREMIERLNRMIPEKNILGELDNDKQIRHYTSHDIYEEVMNFGEGLCAMGLKDAHIAIVSENCCRYILSDICISSGVGIVIPVDFNAPQNLLETLLFKCDADAVICSAAVVDNIRQAKTNCVRLRTIITIDRKYDNLPFYEEIVELGRCSGNGQYRNLELDIDAPAKILFTSGTTGANKGVVLTNANLIANAINCMDTIKSVDGEENTAMSILPMHHATEINTHVMARMASGRVTYVNGNIRDIMTNMKIFKPQSITIVPMIANAFYKNIWMNAKKQGKEEKLKKGIRISNFLMKLGVDKTHDMFKDIHAAFGGRLNMIVCGGSMLNPVVIKGMNDIGIEIENGYGITECGPLISMNAETLKEHLSVGHPCPGIEAKITNPDENGIGDLCVRGKSVFKEYYKDPEATVSVFDEEGFFNTGDAARIDEQGRIILMGRKKNTIVLDNGKNICPEEIENIIETHLDYADEIVVYQASFTNGENAGKFLCAGIYIKDDNKRSQHQSIVEDLCKVNGMLPNYKRIEYLELPDKEYEKTSTRKIRRATVPDRCSGNAIKID